MLVQITRMKCRASGSPNEPQSDTTEERRRQEEETGYCTTKRNKHKKERKSQSRGRKEGRKREDVTKTFLYLVPLLPFIKLTA